jgi:hypothetical protein
MKDALQIIISKSPNAADDALDCIKAIRAKSPVVARRYEHTVQLAFNDPQAEFTPAERALIASYLSADDDTGTKPRISDEDWQRAIEIGEGSATAGIRKALNEYKEQKGNDK